MLDPMMDMEGAMGGWSVFGLTGMLLNLLVLGAFAALIDWGLVWISSSRRIGNRENSAEGILRARFARGELGAEEYRKLLEAMRKDTPQRTYEDYVREAEDPLRSR